MNYYPFHIGDFRSGTVNMSRQSRWIYRDMLDVYYDSEKSLPLDRDVIFDAIGAETEDERRIVERLLKFKFIKDEDGYRHETCDRVIAEYHKKAATAQTNGKLGGRPSKAKSTNNKPSGFQSGCDQVASGPPEVSRSQANQEPITNNHKPLKSKTTTQPDGDLFDGIDQQIVSDFKALRNKKKSAITKTAMEGIRREAVKAGLSLADALMICCERGWAGFKAEWVLQPNARASPARESRHSGFDKIDYSEGVIDGRIG